MAQQDIIIGAENAKDGDTLFDAFTKVQANFTELFGNGSAPAGGRFVADGAGGGEFIRVQGWQQVADSRTVVGTPTQVLSPSVRTKFICDAGTTNIQKLPSDAVAPLWDAATNKITPISAFDTYNLRFDFRAQNYAGATPFITIELDIGAPIGTIVSKTIILAKGGALQREIFSFPVYTGATFLANGGEVFLTYSGTGTCDIFANTALIIRESKNYI